MTERDRGGRVPLHYAALDGNDDAVRSLLGSGEDVNVPDYQGFTPLHFAVQDGRSTTALLLLDAGADIEAAAADGATPLFVAASSPAENASDLIRLLRDRGANAHAAKRNGSTPSGYVRLIGNREKKAAFADLWESDA
ncbi:ankyrin repeat protein [Rhodococcus sp. AG1013]|uniref:ankyrin repeat domain-containing protein n=1 Tax=Rhodococcus sp. AG1013 TaxID=2183996 RepID=UPI000E0C5EA0|nr:ankyrin repeat domain-containing protein [Rhodococcus sp. AG1013]RDI19007.1 ankyrin repeat protein [Rhodococcus sp. AG1013]